MTLPLSKRVLFIDAYDSFTNNVIALLETRLNVQVTVIRIDTHLDDLNTFLKPFSAIILGPGPGDPRNTEDIGLHKKIWQLDHGSLVPVLGICLGFQSLVLAFGGDVRCLAEPRHGIVRNIRNNGKDIFRGIDPLFESVQYHSLHASITNDQTIRNAGRDGYGKDVFRPVSLLERLAWDTDLDNKSDFQTNFELNPSPILMAVRHYTKPFHGLQFHPESICSSLEAQDIIVNWWEQVVEWWKDRSLQAEKVRSPEHPLQSNLAKRNFGADCHLCNGVPCDSHRGHAVDGRHTHSSSLFLINGRATSIDTDKKSQKYVEREKILINSKSISLASHTVPEICSKLKLAEESFLVLDSENHQRAEIGQYSIIGIVSSDSLRFEYTTGTGHFYQYDKGQSTKIDLSGIHEGRPLLFLKSFMQEHEAEISHSDMPFSGGLVGYISYEACLENIGVRPRLDIEDASHESITTDLSFVFVERSIVISHVENKVYIQSIAPDDDTWLETMAHIIDRCDSAHLSVASVPPLNARVALPSEQGYKSAISAAQASIRAGDSYELCLTTEAAITTRKNVDPWSLYLRLRQLNPAPFAAYLQFGGLTLLSSSPERFLSWSRPRRQRGNGYLRIPCQFRPIKGTVQRQANTNTPPLTLQQAKELLATPKERAENLMIVDLIRHDLHGVVGSGNVSVPRLMVVEEYKTLFQLVSVIEGTLDVPGTSVHRDFLATRAQHALNASAKHVRNPIPATDPTSGIDVLDASLPPGSMTGAPKLRSCQLLQSLERRNRGVYSGVVGYLDVGGGGDFSVVIRSAVRWDGNSSASSNRMNKMELRDNWTIGAGGAITALSTVNGEYEEMMGKLKSTLRLFED